jgi:hypothetical protein
MLSPPSQLFETAFAHRLPDGTEYHVSLSDATVHHWNPPSPTRAPSLRVAVSVIALVTCSGAK